MDISSVFSSSGLPNIYAATGTQNLVFSLVAATPASSISVDISGLGMLLSSASLLDRALSGAAVSSNFSSVLAVTQHFADAFNNYLQGLQLSSGTSAADLLVQGLNVQTASGGSLLTQLSGIGITYQPPLNQNSTGQLTVDFKKLQAAFQANQSSSVSLLTQATRSIGQLATQFASRFIQLDFLAQISNPATISSTVLAPPQASSTSAVQTGSVATAATAAASAQGAASSVVAPASSPSGSSATTTTTATATGATTGATAGVTAGVTAGAASGTASGTAAGTAAGTTAGTTLASTVGTTATTATTSAAAATATGTAATAGATGEISTGVAAAAFNAAVTVAVGVNTSPVAATPPVAAVQAAAANPILLASTLAAVQASVVGLPVSTLQQAVASTVALAPQTSTVGAVVSTLPQPIVTIPAPVPEPAMSVNTTIASTPGVLAATPEVIVPTVIPGIYPIIDASNPAVAAAIAAYHLVDGFFDLGKLFSDKLKAPAYNYSEIGSVAPVRAISLNLHA
jgi:hypothetical protein